MKSFVVINRLDSEGIVLWLHYWLTIIMSRYLWREISGGGTTNNITTWKPALVKTHLQKSSMYHCAVSSHCTRAVSNLGIFSYHGFFCRRNLMPLATDITITITPARML